MLTITLTIDGREIPFKSVKNACVKYRKLLKRDLTNDLYEIVILDKNYKGPYATSLLDLKKIDHDTIYHMCWFLAKNANNDLPDPEAWLNEFKEFPLFEITASLKDLFIEMSKQKGHSVWGLARKMRF